MNKYLPVHKMLRFANALLVTSLLGVTFLPMSIGTAVAAPKAPVRQPVISLNPEFKSLALGGSQIVDVVVDSGDFALSSFNIKIVYTPNAVYQAYTSVGAAFDTTISNPVELGNSVSFARSQRDANFKGSGIVMRLQFKPNKVDTMHLYIDQAASEVYDASGHNVLWKVNEGFFSVIHVDPVVLPTAQPAPTYMADVPVYRGDRSTVALATIGAASLSSNSASNASRYIMWGMVLSGLVAVATYVSYMRKTFTW
jgi:hypothetical protein